MKCPICKSEACPEFRPFCSRRCADIDLARWVTGGYAIPSPEPLDEEDVAEIEAQMDPLRH